MTEIPMPEPIYCKRCGKLIGTKDGDCIRIRHKGRQIKIIPDVPCSCTVRITCEKETCKFVTEIRV